MHNFSFFSTSTQHPFIYPPTSPLFLSSQSILFLLLLLLLLFFFLSLSLSLPQEKRKGKISLSRKYQLSDKKMEQNLPVIAKRAWGIVRVIFFMLRKGISKRKLLLDLNMMLKRGNKIASKAIGNLMFHHHNRGDMSFTAPPCEYEFSCSNTPNYSFPFHLNKRRHHHHHHNNFFGCAFHAPPTHDDDMTTMNAVKLALEMLNNNNEVVVPIEAASPILPGFGRSPMVRQLRITDSPFPLRDVDDDNGYVDKKAEEFIQKFYKDLRQQKRRSG